MTEELEITYGSAIILKDILQSRGWYKDLPIDNVTSAYEIAARKLANVENIVKKDDESDEDYNARVKEETEKPFTLKLNKKERKTCRSCIYFYVKQANINITIHIYKLITGFKIGE